MSHQHPVTGGKKPRQVFRLDKGSKNFSIVNFLDDKGRQTREQEIVPTLWIINSKKPLCYWPKKKLTKREVERLVESEASPNKTNYTPFPIRILLTGCTFAEAKRKFDQLAETSNLEDGGGADNSADADNDSISDFDEISSPCKSSSKRKRSKHSNSSSKKKKTKHDDESFEFESESESDLNHPNLNKSLLCEQNISTGSPSGIASKTVKEVSCSGMSSQSSPVVRSLVFSDEPSTHRQCVTKAEFEAFEVKHFRKLNAILECVKNIETSSPKGRELIAFPKSVSDHCPSAAKDVESLEKLDELLQNPSVKAELATYLTQMGGKNMKDFLARALPVVVADEVCYLTNWSGSAISAGSLDAQGNEISRDFKKTFSNLHNIIDVFFAASRAIDVTTTKALVEKYIKGWLLHFRDRLQPRSHEATKPRKSPRKKKTSPKKPHEK